MPAQAMEPVGMGNTESVHRCDLCKKTFKQKSSLIRHRKKCTLEPKLSVRQKACKSCTAAKARCDLLRPTCSRCSTRGVPCAYVRPVAAAPDVEVSGEGGISTAVEESHGGAGAGAGGVLDSFFATAAGGFPDLMSVDNVGLTADLFSNTTTSSPSPATGLSTYTNIGGSTNTSLETTPFLDPSLCGGEIPSLNHHTLSSSSSPPNSILPSTNNNTNNSLLGPPPKTPQALDHWMLALVSRPLVHDPHELIMHSMRLVLRVLRTWPRTLAKGFQLPPIIHPFQFRDGIPLPLANCTILCKMWAAQEDGAAPIVGVALRREVDQVLEKYREYDEPTLLAAFQSIIIVTMLLVFPTPTQTSFSSIPSSTWEKIQAMGIYVASSGLVLQEELANIRPAWQVWTHVEAKRRAMMSLYILHWAYSVYNAQTHFDCTELSRMPAAAAKFLWQATDEESWNTLYTRWLAQWDGRAFLQAEFMLVEQGIVMNRRTETWLEDADELGFVMMSIVNAAERGISRVRDAE